MMDPKNIYTILKKREVEGTKVAIYSNVQNKIIEYVDSEIKNNGIDFSFLGLRSHEDKIKKYLTENEFQGLNFEQANFFKMNLELAFLAKANLERANLAKANLRRANLGVANLVGADLGGADLRGSCFGGANLRGADLTRADLSGANLSEANLESANLQGTKLCRANLGGANLRGADLRGTNLLGVNFTRADLRGTNLLGVNFTTANLAGANLGGVNLRGVNLGGADLRGANLRDANLEGVIQNAFSAMNNLDRHDFLGFHEKTLSSLSYLLETGILSNDQIKSMFKVEETPLSEQLRTMVDNMKFFIDFGEFDGLHYFDIDESEKKKMFDFIEIIAEKEKEIREKEVPASTPAIPSSSPSHESDDRVAKRQRVGRID